MCRCLGLALVGYGLLLRLMLTQPLLPALLLMCSTHSPQLPHAMTHDMYIPNLTAVTAGAAITLLPSNCLQAQAPRTPPTCSQLRCCRIMTAPLVLAHHMLPALSTTTAVIAARSV